MIVRLSLRSLSLVAALVFAGSLSTGALAQNPPPSNPNPTPAAINVAKELLALKGGVEMFNGMVNGVIESAKNAFLPTNPSLAKPLGEVTVQLRTEYEPKKNEVYTEVARAYATRFTEAEMKELLAFYRTNLGKKVLTEEPIAVEEAFRKAQDWSNTFSEQVITRMRIEMKKKGHDL
jgi:hypothetical protein